MAASCSVLVVEDDVDTREALTAILENQGFAVASAEDGVDALEHLRASNCVCLIVLDLFMPRMNGWVFREEQMKDPELARIPVVVVSADPAAARRAEELGVAAAMAKPIDFDRLLQVVGRYC
jgi:CheY-like chemotaxis protein